ncbi:hypothetical protein ACYF6T_38980 [Streptomyces sp. 7R007]
MYTGLAHTGVGAAILTVAAVITTLAGLITKRAAKRGAHRRGGNQ